MLQYSLCGRAASVLGHNLADRQRVAAEMLIAGVAFQTSGTSWDVFSHNGVHIGEMSTHMVNETTRALKSMGLRRVSITDPAAGEQPSITFGHSYPGTEEEMELLMARRERGFSTLN